MCKITVYIANKLLILGIVNSGNDLIPIINYHQAGFVFENGDYPALLIADVDLAVSGELRHQCGEDARYDFIVNPLSIDIALY